MHQQRHNALPRWLSTMLACHLSTQPGKRRRSTTIVWVVVVLWESPDDSSPSNNNAVAVAAVSSGRGICFYNRKTLGVVSRVVGQVRDYHSSVHVSREGVTYEGLCEKGYPMRPKEKEADFPKKNTRRLCVILL
jgi:hypothetical protein